MPKKKSPKERVEQKSPNEKAVDAVFGKLEEEISGIEKNWVDLVQSSRGKVDLIFKIFDAKEELDAIREHIRAIVSKKEFKDMQISQKIRSLKSRLRIVREGIPPLVISPNDRDPSHAKVVG